MHIAAGMEESMRDHACEDGLRLPLRSVPAAPRHDMLSKSSSAGLAKTFAQRVGRIEEAGGRGVNERAAA